MKTGTVFLVGAGPGDPGLLTLRGAEVLATADLVLYDGLVNPLLLRLTRGQVERTARARRGNEAIVTQEEVNRRLIEAARAGLCVVRLKGGDPFLFGRGSEEARALAEAGVPFEVVPGVTAAIAAGEYAGISFTHRELASAVAFVTGHEDPTKSASSLDYAALARFPGTLVFYMGLHRVQSIATALIDAGLSAGTPAAVVGRASLPSQRTVVSSLSDLPAAVLERGIQPPSLIVIGECVSQRETIAWFEKRPLFGMSIGITRPQEIAPPFPTRSLDTGLSGTISRCLALGAEPVLMPLIEVERSSDVGPTDALIARLKEFSWIVFTSANGVHAFLGRLWETGGDVRSLGHLKIASIGPGTAAALEEWRLRADLVPDHYRAEDLAAALIPRIQDQRVVWARASRGRDVLPNTLRAAGIEIEEVVVYDNCDIAGFCAEVESRIESEQLDWICLSSPSIARQLSRLLSPAARAKIGESTRLAAISSITATAATEAGLPVHAVAMQFTWEGLFESIIAATGRMR